MEDLHRRGFRLKSVVFFHGLFPQVDGLLHLGLERFEGVGQLRDFGSIAGIHRGHGGVAFFQLGLELRDFFLVAFHGVLALRSALSRALRAL